MTRGRICYPFPICNPSIWCFAGVNAVWKPESTDDIVQWQHWPLRRRCKFTWLRLFLSASSPLLRLLTSLTCLKYAIEMLYVNLYRSSAAHISKFLPCSTQNNHISNIIARLVYHVNLEKNKKSIIHWHSFCEVFQIYIPFRSLVYK